MKGAVGMESSRLKNIIILILVLTDLFLLGSLTSRRTAELSSRRRGEEQLVELFAADQITLDPDLIPYQTPPASRTLVRDLDQERAIATALLGKNLRQNNSGDVVYGFDSDAGAALFRSNGGFDVAGTLSSGSAEEVCREFCKSFGYRDLTFSLENGSGTATATRYYDDYPVVGCTVEFSIDNGVLRTVTGTYLPDTYTETAGETEPLSATAALTAFLSARRASGGVGSAVTDIYLCYELQSTTAAPMSLVPAWCIVTDLPSSVYYVNCITGAVTYD